MTVVYNSAESLKITIDSIKSQSYKDIEYIVVDGASTDETIKIAKENCNVINIFVSEKDDGIYDAMNKSLSFVSGEWVVFLNAGDIFYQNDTLEKIAEHIRKTQHLQPDIIGGGVMFDIEGKLIKCPVKSFEKKWISMPSCHQSTFFKASLHKQYPYNKEYKICADHDLILRLLNKNAVFNSYDEIISIFKWDGLSANNRIKLYQEKLAIAKKHKAPLKFVIMIRFIIIKLMIAKFLRKVGVRK
ncbi:glycosyltransferase family 2 protein [Buttiauxella agrestis]|uniref:glycosyltransferase family 2 protein n=1 Tax=Buttiauxella agrestis TaxID=82977 RepID=UPI001E2EB74E|nr:glycosyltransferase family 2 protein [Buttiauxella agrestis]